jgi:hypothetical protein
MIEKNQIYLWEEGLAILGYSYISINGVEEEFGAGYEIGNNKNGLAKNRAIRQVKIQFANVIDAIKLYGKKILDKEGNIDQKEFLNYEKAIQRSKAKIGLIDLKEKNKFTKLKDLKVNMITEDQANKLQISNN